MQISTYVVPLVGTWIEITTIGVTTDTTVVVPLVGTWIEILQRKGKLLAKGVVPLVGTWIEIMPSAMISSWSGRRAPRGHVD